MLQARQQETIEILKAPNRLLKNAIWLAFGYIKIN